jgi:hypothetical protein
MKSSIKPSSQIITIKLSLLGPFFFIRQSDERRILQGLIFHVTQLSRQQGPIACVIKEGRLYRPPPIIRPTNNDAFSAEKDPQIKERCKIMEQLPEKEYKLFHHIWGNCSKESQSQIILLR